MRVGIVNDLALAREILKRLVTSVPAHSVAWVAEDGAEAVRKTALDRPDVILMDLIMPVMDGVEATGRIMAATPCPILLVTSSVTGNFDRVCEAMGRGGLDAVNTPKFGPNGIILDGEAILDRIAKIERARSFSTIAPVPLSSTAICKGKTDSLLAIGASTGGPEALQKVLAGLPKEFPAPVVIVQHISPLYVPSLANWLQGTASLKIEVASEGTIPKPSVAYLACSENHLVLRADGSLGYTVEPADYPYRPSVNAAFESLSANWPKKGTAILLTGMGNDGASGLAKLRAAGWHTIAQDQASSIVYGMPKAAMEINAASEILPLNQMTKRIRELFA